jgi:ribosomal protein S2
LSDLTKQEKNRLTKKREVFERFLGGVKDMGHLPNLIVLRSDREINPIKEAKMLSIPTIALVDTTSNPTNITYPVPGNNKSLSTVEMYFNLISRACLLGLQHLSVQPKAPEPVERHKHEGGGRPYRFGRQHFTPRAYVKSHHERQDEQVPVKE